MNNRPTIRAAKYTIYCLFMLALYILQTTPGFLSIGGLKPNFVIPVAMAIAVCEGDFPGGIFGAVAGILCDFSATSLFGFQAAILLACCTAAGLLTVYLLRPTIVNFILLLAAALLIHGMLIYLLNFYMWGYEDVILVLTRRILPSIIYTLLLSPLPFLAVHRLHERFEEWLEE